VLALALAEDLTVREATLTRADFSAADEAFLTATSIPIAPIGAIDGHALAGAPGPVTTKLAARLAAAQHGDDAAFAAWLTSVG
jgi:branched-subunit amino acid aminotransferase/4-amino-4-deoxychorismate lyase